MKIQKNKTTTTKKQNKRNTQKTKDKKRPTPFFQMFFHM